MGDFSGGRLNERLRSDSLEMLCNVADGSVAAAFFDPQYRGVLDKLGYGNEGVGRGGSRVGLPQMSEEFIAGVVAELDRVLRPSGHLFLWVDKFHLCEGIRRWVGEVSLETVDLITWHKMTVGMGYRSRRACEYLVVLQKPPRRAKGVWTVRTITDVWAEKTDRKQHPHRKPVELQAALIEATTKAGDLVVDPAAGSFSVLESCVQTGRNFLGCDVLTPPTEKPR